MAAVQLHSHFWVTLLRVLQRMSLVVLIVLALLLIGVRFYPSPWVFPTFPRITRTSSGAPGDPCNVVLVGSAAQVMGGFTRAGWLVPDPITSATSARIAADSLAQRAYPKAPVSNLYVFGRHQDLAFEWPANNVQNRGHVRLRQTTLYSGGQPVWLGATTYDHGIELSGRTGLPTHHILPAVDLERDTIGADLKRTGLTVADAYDPFTPPILVAYNGGGDYYASDGQVLVITFTHVALPTQTGVSMVIAALTRSLFRAYDAVLTILPIAVAAVIVIIGLLVLAIWPIVVWLWQQVRRCTAHASDTDQGQTS